MSWFRKEMFAITFVSKWKILLLSSPFSFYTVSWVLLIQRMCIHWKAFQNFWWADGNYYANREMSKLSLPRPTHQTLPSPLLSQILSSRSSMGLRALHLITPSYPPVVSVSHLYISFNLSSWLPPLHVLFTSFSFAVGLYWGLLMEH